MVHRFFALPVLVLVLPVCAIDPAQAALIGRLADADGNYRAVYDTELGISWLADANLSATTGHDEDGLMTWDAARQWIAGLNESRYLGVTNWRLPISDTCSGYNCTGSELGHLFYADLGGQPGYGAPMPPLSDPDLALFTNLHAVSYWSGTAYGHDAAWVFEFGAYDVGRQIYFLQDEAFYAWAVRDGDIGDVVPKGVSSMVVPLPAALGLFGAGLAGIFGCARKTPARAVSPAR